MLIKDLLISKKGIDKVAIKHDGKSITYAELFDAVESNAGLLRSFSNINIKNVGIFLPNSIQYVVAYFVVFFWIK